MSRMAEIHADLTALRAVDACGGTYTAAEEASGFAAGHRAALASAMVGVGPADALASMLLGALEALTAETRQLVNTLALATDRTTRHLYDLDSIATHAERKLEPRLNLARAVIAKAVGSEAA